MQQALAEAEIGSNVLFGRGDDDRQTRDSTGSGENPRHGSSDRDGGTESRGLAASGGFGPLEVVDGTAIVPVTVPIVAGDAREHVEREIRDAALALDDVDAVECRFTPDVSDDGARVEFIPEVKNVVAIASGKGGVGKSTVAVNVAVALSNAGADVGLLDADVYGPNAHTMLGLDDRTPDATLDDTIIPREAHGVRIMSTDFVTDEDDPVIWRGPVVDDFIAQFFGDVEWGALDYLIVDLPPGTGDAHLSLVQHLPVTGAAIVTTPQPVAVDDASRNARAFDRYGVPVLGVVENMTSFECPDCGSDSPIFDVGGGDQLARDVGVPVLGGVPIDPAVGTLKADEDTEPPGISIPGLGRLQLPQTRAERERPESVPPVSIRDDGGDSRVAFERIATRIAAHVARLGADDVPAREVAPD